MAIINPSFSLIIYANDTNLTFFRDCLESIVQQTYTNYELYVLDGNSSNTIEAITKEFFPGNKNIHYRELRNNKGGAYACNIGAHYATGDYVVYVGQHDRLSENCLELMSDVLGREKDEKCAIYTDNDEIAGMDRVNPQFKSGFNKELFLRTNYIGAFICFSGRLLRENGEFQEKARYGYFYEYMLRLATRKINIVHVPGLLYHRRILGEFYDNSQRTQDRYAFKEYQALAVKYASISGVGVKADGGSMEQGWNITYDGSDYKLHKKEYMVIRTPGIRLMSTGVIAKMWGYLRQHNVGIVGCRVMKNIFTIDNIGYIFDTNGLIYPAFNGQKVYQNSLYNLRNFPRDVSMVDPSFCMIDAKLYRQLNGFDARMTQRDAMLDFCLRAKEHDIRTIVDPDIVVMHRHREDVTSEISHNALMESRGDMIEQGDPFYNPILPIGLDNYRLY